MDNRRSGNRGGVDDGNGERRRAGGDNVTGALARLPEMVETAEQVKWKDGRQNMEKLAIRFNLLLSEESFFYLPATENLDEFSSREEIVIMTME